MLPPEESFGSGKLGTPWERMHAESFSACSSRALCCAGLGADPAGAYLLHAFSAAFHWGDCGFGPWPFWPWIWMWPSVGSGNSGAPWVRMHCANSTSFCCAAALDSPDSGVPPLDPPAGLEALVAATWATPGFEE